MAIYKEDIVDIELESGTIHRSWLMRAIGLGDAKGNRFGVRLLRNGEPVNVGSATVTGLFMAPNGTNYVINESQVSGSTWIDGSVAGVILPSGCYAVEGQFCLAIKLSQSGVVTTMRIIDGMVSNTGTTGAVVPSSNIPTGDQIIAAYQQAMAVIDNSVRYDVSQELTNAQKRQARLNVNAAGMALLAPVYSATSTYAVGDHVHYDGYYYVCNTAITTAEAWTDAHWTQVTVGGEVSDLKSAFISTIKEESNIASYVQGYYSTPTNVVYRSDRVSTKTVELFSGTKIHVSASESIYSLLIYFPTSGGNYSQYPTTFTNSAYDFVLPTDAYVSIMFKKASGDISISDVDTQVTVYSSVYQYIDGEIDVIEQNTHDGKEIQSIIAGYYSSPTTTVLRTDRVTTEITEIWKGNIVSVSASNNGIQSLLYYWPKAGGSMVQYPSAFTSGEFEYAVPVDAYVSVMFKKASGDIAPSEVDTKVKVLSDSINGRWSGKKFVFFGDSRTWYDGKEYIETTKTEWRGKTCKGYQQQIISLLGIQATNQGVSGNTSAEICTRIRSFDFSNYDAVFLEGGVNDFIKASQVTIGELQPIGSTFDTATVYGAWQSAVEYILTNYPAIKIYIDVPAIAWAGDTVFPYTTAKIKADVAELYNIPCLDLYKNAGINVVNRDYFYCDDVSLTTWRLHFNDYGNELIGQIIAGFISTH